MIKRRAKPHDRARFSVDALRTAAGDKAFARGEAYFRDGRVVILGIDPKRVVAQVAGSEDYHIVLTGRGEHCDGECSCPAFEDWGFCKHMVAVAMAANAAETGAEAEGAGALARIRAHLKDKGVDALVEMIVNQAERDPALFRRLDLAATATHADERTLKASLRKAIDSATHTSGFVDYREAPGWAAGVEDVLRALGELVPGGRATLALELIDHAIARISRAFDNVDDSDGHCSAIMQQARDVHLDACRTAKPDPVQLARYLFAAETEGDYDTFDNAAPLYAAVLGEAGLAEYRRLAAEAWGKLPTRTGPGRGSKGDEGEHDSYRLQSILDFFAERDGDVDARIVLRTKDLSSPWSYLQLAQFCLAQDRVEEALRRAEEGLWVFEDHPPDERLVLFTATLLAKAGRKADAESHLWRAFGKTPSFELYAQLRNLGGKPARDRVVRHLESGIVGAERSIWHHPADLLIRVLMHEKAFDAAWAAVRGHGASRSIKNALAGASEATHPREAIGTYAERVEELAAAGGNGAYAEAVQLIGRMAALRDSTEQAAYVADLKARLGRKRNFMKMLA